VRFLLFIFTITSSVLVGQTVRPNSVISGRVLDESGSPVPKAEVRLYNRLTRVQTNGFSDGEGRYRFEHASAGEFLIQASAAEAQLASEAVSVAVREGEKKEIELKLRLAPRSDRVAVTATASPETVASAGKALDTLERADFEARNEISVVEALRVVPGLRVQQLGGPGSFARIQMRGLRAADTGLLIDGMRMRDAAAVQGDATAYLGDLLLVDAERIEVLRGLGSAVYGTNATAGVVNIVTDQGGGPLRGEISGEGGSLGLARGAARLAGGALNNRLNFSGGVAHLNVNGGIDGVENVRNSSGQGSIQWRPVSAASLSGRYYGGFGTIGVNSSPVAAPPANLPPTGTIPAIALPHDQMLLGDQGQSFSWGNATFGPNFYDPDGRRIGHYSATMLAWQHQAAPRFNYRVSYQNLLTGRDTRNGPGGTSFQPAYNNSSVFDGRIDTVQARADFAPVRWNLLAIGYEYEREWYENISSDQNPNPLQKVDASASAAQRSNAVFFQNQTRLLDERLQLHVTGRFQSYSLSQPVFRGGAPRYEGASFEAPPNALTGDVSLSYFIPKTSSKLRAHAGNGYRAPALYERIGTSFFFGAFSPLGDPGLRPERTVSFDFGFDQYLAGDRVRAGATYFYTRLQEVIGYMGLTNDPWGRFGGYANTGGGLARGLELTFEGRPSRRTQLQTTYTWTNADERRSALVGGMLQSIRVFPHAFSAQFTQQATRRLQFAADFLAASDYVSGSFFTGSGNRPYLFPGPRKLDLSANYTVHAGERRSLKFTFRVENVLNREFYEDGFRTPRAWATAGMRFSF
jgi:iron complex outermembrane receptor protein